MRESEIISRADSLKQLITYFGADQYLDMRTWYWRTGSHWIDIDYTTDFNMNKHIPLGWDVDCPRLYLEYSEIALAIIEMGNVDYLCVFDTEKKV